MIDTVPTILEAADIQAPEVVNGIKQKPIESVTMAYTFDQANAQRTFEARHSYFEMFCNRAIYHDGWIVMRHAAPSKRTARAAAVENNDGS
jgi:arylsulfatase A-like enzyme